jgi:hypothetical protein
MSFDEACAERIRRALFRRKTIGEKKLLGGYRLLAEWPRAGRRLVAKLPTK